MKKFVSKILLPLTVIAATPQAAFSQSPSSPESSLELRLDIDNDGMTDRVIIAPDADDIYRELHIYLGAGDEKLDPSRKPSFLKKEFMSDPIRALRSNDKGSLVVVYGRGGSNDYENTLTIVHRGGQFLVAGYSSQWDTRRGIGSCDINFLSGKGFASKGIDGKNKPLRGKFSALKLADWSSDNIPKACWW